jgi:hypothetical protein
MRRLKVRRKRELLLRGDDALRGGNSLGFLATDGALFDPSLDERWRQVSDGTVPAGAGDPVGWGQDLTAGKLLTQATTGNRPTRVLTGDVWGLEFDGTSDRLGGDAAMRDIFRNAPGASIACVVEPGALNDGRIFAWARATDAGVRLECILRTDGGVQVQWRRADSDSLASYLTPTSIMAVGQKQIIVIRHNWAGSTANIRVGGTSRVTAALAGSGNTQDTASFSMRIGANTGDSIFQNMRLHGPFIVAPRVWSDAQVQAIERRLSAITGAPLS